MFYESEEPMEGFKQRQVKNPAYFFQGTLSGFFWENGLRGVRGTARAPWGGKAPAAIQISNGGAGR